MKNKYRIPIVAISVALIGGAIIYGVSRKRKRDEEFLKKTQELKDLSAKELKELEDKLKNASKTEKEALKDQLLTDIGNVKQGKFAYAITTVNVRDEPYVNNAEGTWDFIDNIIGYALKGKIGRVDKVVNSSQYGDKLKWYQVKRDKPEDSEGNAYGYVREDAIKIQNL